MRPTHAVPQHRIERAARLYRSNRDAALALGITPGAFSRLCRRYGVDTPQARRRKELEALQCG